MAGGAFRATAVAGSIPRGGDSEEQKAFVDETTRQRRELELDIEKLSEKRLDYISKKVDEAGGAVESLDEKIYSAVRDQAAKHGLSYEEDAVAY